MNKTEIHLRPLPMTELQRMPEYEKGLEAAGKGKTFDDMPPCAAGSHAECAWALGFVHGHEEGWNKIRSGQSSLRQPLSYGR